MPLPDHEAIVINDASALPSEPGFWLHELPGHRVRRLHQRLVAEFNAIVARHPAFDGVTHMQFAALAAIDYRPGCDQASVARLIGCDKVTGGQLIERMVERGWVSRVIDPDDRRARALHLTSSGSAMLARVRPHVTHGSLVDLQPLTETERATFVALLARLTLPLDPA